MRLIFSLVLGITVGASFFSRAAQGGQAMSCEIKKSDSEWKEHLDDQQFHVLRQKGTERAFTGKYWDNHSKGLYRCAGCGAELFESDAKFDSGTGWPSFWQPVKKDAVAEETDKSHGMIRTEAKCPKCGGHLGHVFDDGPKPTGRRYCINSAALKFEEKKTGS